MKNVLDGKLTYTGILVFAIAAILNHYGVDYDFSQLNEFVSISATNLAEIIGGIVAWIGRIRAGRKLKEAQATIQEKQE